MTVQLGEDLDIVVCGRGFRVPRSLETLQRAEKIVGALRPWAERLDQRAVQIYELVAIWRAILTEQPCGPSLPGETEIEDWVFDKGLAHHDDLAVFLYSLTMGEDEIERVRNWQARKETFARRWDEHAGSLNGTSPLSARQGARNA